MYKAGGQTEVLDIGQWPVAWHFCGTWIKSGGESLELALSKLAWGNCSGRVLDCKDERGSPRSAFGLRLDEW